MRLLYHFFPIAQAREGSVSDFNDGKVVILPVPIPYSSCLKCLSMQLQRSRLSPFSPLCELLPCIGVAEPQRFTALVENNEQAADAEDDGHAQHTDAVVSRAQDPLSLADVQDVGVRRDLELFEGIETRSELKRVW